MLVLTYLASRSPENPPDAGKGLTFSPALRRLLRWGRPTPSTLVGFSGKMSILCLASDGGVWPRVAVTHSQGVNVTVWPTQLGGRRVMRTLNALSPVSTLRVAVAFVGSEDRTQWVRQLPPLGPLLTVGSLPWSSLSRPFPRSPDIRFLFLRPHSRASILVLRSLSHGDSASIPVSLAGLQLHRAGAGASLYSPE